MPLERACEGIPDRLAEILDALATELADQARYPEAIECERRAVELAERSGRTAELAEYRARLSDFEDRRE